jgi:hypothetical protein
MRRGRALTHLGALWRVLFAAFRKQYMGFGRGLRIGAGDRKEERRVYGAWNKLFSLREFRLGSRGPVALWEKVVQFQFGGLRLC